MELIKSLTAGVRDLYQFLWSRQVSSVLNGQFEPKNGRPYVICTRMETAEYLKCGRDKAIECFKELNTAGLIPEIRTTRAKIIFVHDVVKQAFRVKYDSVKDKIVRSDLVSVENTVDKHSGKKRDITIVDTTGQFHPGRYKQDERCRDIFYRWFKIT